MFRVVYTLGVRKALNMSNAITYVPQETTLRMADIGNKDLAANFRNLSLGSMEEYHEENDRCIT